jgi:galactokinase
MMIAPIPMDDFTGSDIQQLVGAASERFDNRNCWVIRVPARLCLAADHTDYWEVFTPELVTFASDSALMNAVISPRSDSMIRLFNVGDFEYCEFDLNEVAPPRATEENGWIDWLDACGTPVAHWSNYVRGSVQHAQMHHDVKVGFDLLIDSNIPPASGASSSSALATCASIAIRLANDLPLEQSSLVEETANAEWFVGTRGGMMDHATMMFAEEGKMLRLTFRPFSAQSLDSSTQLADYRFVTIFTHPSDKSRSTQLAFNARALAARDIIPQMLADSADDLPDVLGVADVSDEVMRKYPTLHSAGEGELRIKNWLAFARGELQRSQEVQVLLHTNGAATTLGSYMNQAWRDAGELYGIRTPQMDQIADLCRGCNGVMGVKVMGAGFGGNLLALVREDCLEGLRNTLTENQDLFSRSVQDSIIVHNPGHGVSIMSGPEGDMNWSPLWPNREV